MDQKPEEKEVALHRLQAYQKGGGFSLAVVLRVDRIPLAESDPGTTQKAHYLLCVHPLRPKLQANESATLHRLTRQLSPQIIYVSRCKPCKTSVHLIAPQPK